MYFQGYVFQLLTIIQPGLHIECHYNEANHGKGPMDGIGGTIKNLVYRRVLARDIVINNPKQFASYANEICKVDSLYLPSQDLLQEPDEVKNATCP